MGSKFRITYINDIGHIRQKDIAAGSVDEALQLFRRNIDGFVMMIILLD